MLAGGAIYFRTNLQPTIALSSTEAEFMTMANAGKAALYIRWILTELQQEVDTTTPIKTTENDGIPRKILDPTTIKADNAGAVKIASAQQPTRRVRHVEMKYFAILQWTEDKYLKYQQTDTTGNYSDSLSKINGSTKHHEHFDIAMGRRPPIYTMKINEAYINIPEKETEVYLKNPENIRMLHEGPQQDRLSAHTSLDDLQLNKKTVRQSFELFTPINTRTSRFCERGRV